MPQPHLVDGDAGGPRILPVGNPPRQGQSPPAGLSRINGSQRSIFFGRCVEGGTRVLQLFYGGLQLFLSFLDGFFRDLGPLLNQQMVLGLQPFEFRCGQCHLLLGGRGDTVQCGIRFLGVPRLLGCDPPSEGFQFGNGNRLLLPAHGELVFGSQQFRLQLARRDPIAFNLEIEEFRGPFVDPQRKFSRSARYGQDVI